MISALSTKTIQKSICLMLFQDSVYTNLDKGSTLSGMDITVHEVESCTNFSSVSLGKIRELTLHDNDLQVLKTHIINGFPLHTNQCPECIRPFFSLQG